LVISNLIGQKVKNFERDAKKICPEVHAFVVEEKYGKACLNLYRDASRRGMGSEYYDAYL